MMKRKIFILTLALVFLVSTTGLPLIIHYCKMMETASLQACEMHNKEIKKSSCCEEADIADIYYSKLIDECCEDLLVDHSVKENFVINKTESPAALYLYTYIPVALDLTSNHQTYFKVDTSPPLLSSNKIYLTNSVLLI
jgi:hypothetical protein